MSSSDLIFENTLDLDKGYTSRPIIVADFEVDYYLQEEGDISYTLAPLGDVDMNLIDPSDLPALVDLGFKVPKPSHDRLYIEQVLPYTPNGGGNILLTRQQGKWYTRLAGYHTSFEDPRKAKRFIYRFVKNIRKDLGTIDQEDFYLPF